MSLTGEMAPLVTKILISYLRDQFATTVNQLQKREEATEILVGFAPEFNPEESVQLGPASEASTHQKTVTLHQVQGRVDERARSVLGKVQPSKAEAYLPGVAMVDQDLSRLTAENLDSSWLTNTVRMMATPSMIGKLARSSKVAFVIPNFEVRLPRPVEITEADLKPVQERQRDKPVTWGLDTLKIPQLWDKGLRGKDVLIGHLDTGVDESHPDLKERVKEFAVFDPRGQSFKSEFFDSDTHGTHTAGTIVGGNASGLAIGVAPEAQLVSALVLMRGSGTVYQIIKGIEWAISQKVRILNLSLGGVGYSSIYEYALTRVVAAGVLPVCSIGNEGLAVTGSPGNIASACGVGAIDSDGQPASFSGGGSIGLYNKLGQLLEVHKPDVVAPGVAVYSSLPQGRWGELNGTSMAAPHLTGIAALLIQAKPSAPLTDLLQAIYSTAKHPTAKDGRRDSRFGRGVIDPVAALERLTS